MYVGKTLSLTIKDKTSIFYASIPKFVDAANKKHIRIIYQLKLRTMFHIRVNGSFVQLI